MTLQQLRQVLTIAESNSMNEAAKKLFVSQPNLSATVREVEEELGITVFMRNNRGITVTAEGEEFLGYAKQVVEQYHLLENRYLNVESKKKFSVSMQHYSFAVKAFVQLAKEVGMDEYEFAVHETKTKEVIDNVKNLKSEIGVLYLSDNEFTELFTCNTYVYLWKKHPLAGQKEITLDDLQEYPCLTFEQGVNNSFYYAEEMMSTYEYKRVIKADDRATMLNLMVGLNGFTLCSGIISEDLNGDDYAAIPLKESEKMHIGYIKHKGTKLSKLGEIYIDALKNYENKVL